MSSVIECSCMLHYSYHFLLSSTDSKAQSNYCLLWLQTTTQSARSASPVRPPAHPPLHQHQPGRRRRGGRARNAILQVTTISSAFNCRYNQRKGSRTSAPRALQPTAPMPACQADVASGMPHASLSSCRLFGPTLLLSRAPLLQTTTLNGLSAFHARLNARPLPRRRRLSPLLPRAGHARLATSTITTQGGRNAARESKRLLCEVPE